MNESAIKESEINTVIEYYYRYDTPFHDYCIGEVLHYKKNDKCNLCIRLFPDIVQQSNCPCEMLSDDEVRLRIKNEMLLYYTTKWRVADEDRNKLGVKTT